MDKKEELVRTKIKLSEVLNEIGWLMPEDEYHETFEKALKFVEGK